MKKCSEEQEYGRTIKEQHKVSDYVWRSMEITESQLLVEHLRRMDHVTRLSGVRKNRNYSLTEHCYHTAILFKEIAMSEGIQVNLSQFEWVLKHDVLETVTGDVLFPAKNYNDETKSLWRQIENELVRGSTYSFLGDYTDDRIEEILTKPLIRIFKIADIMELYLFCEEERHSGNEDKHINQTIKNCVEILDRERNIEYVRDFLRIRGYSV